MKKTIKQFNKDLARLYKQRTTLKEMDNGPDSRHSMLIDIITSIMPTEYYLGLTVKGIKKLVHDIYNSSWNDMTLELHNCDRVSYVVALTERKLGILSSITSAIHQLQEYNNNIIQDPNYIDVEAMESTSAMVGVTICILQDMYMLSLIMRHDIVELVMHEIK